MHCTTCNVNLCVLGYPLFHSDDNIVNMEEYISTRYKGLKAIKIAKFCTLVWYKIPHISCTSILVTMESILPQVVPYPKHKTKFAANKQFIYV